MKKITALGLALLLAMTTVGCGTTNTIVEETTMPAEAAIETNEIVDQLGRTVQLPKQIDRVVSSYYITTSLIIALQAQDKLVGIEMKPDKRPIYKKAAPEIIELPQVGNSKTISVEECASLEAQVVIIPTKLEEFIEPLEKLGICVVAVEPEDLDRFLDCIKLVGTIVGKQDRAEQLITYYQDKVEFITDLTKDITEQPSVLLLGTDMLSTCTTDMYQSSLIAMAGGVNIASDVKKGKWVAISKEQIIQYNPDVILNLSYSDFTLEEVAAETSFAQIPAVQNKQMYTFPSKLEPWDYPTPSSALGMLWLTSTLHPDLYSAEQYVQDAKDFYQEFFGITVTEEEIGA
ncbi:MAG: ABC transporter substrate-binding protein [Lachnospiraceae bacterium]